MNRLIRVSAIAIALFSSGIAFAQSKPQTDSTAPAIPVAPEIPGRYGMVVAQERHAANIGVDILNRGGNAVDAAVAVGFAMAVTFPAAGNLGGGGFMVIHLAKENRNLALDYRETAPAAATKDMFLDGRGNPDPNKSRDSGLAVGVPGTVAGLVLAEEKYGSGKFSLSDLIAPAIKLARDGFPVENDLSSWRAAVARASSKSPHVRALRTRATCRAGSVAFTASRSRSCSPARECKTAGIFKIGRVRPCYIDALFA
jgi:gamma-glutamyltranspeptidase / glutathione hydrolase